MNKYRKKPVVVEAVQWFPNDPVSAGTVTAWIMSGNADLYLEDDGVLCIKTLEGTMEAIEGDWIIKGVVGEFYPCKAPIFEATYEKVEDD